MQQQSFQSHPPMRPLATPSTRAMQRGEARFVDAKRGNDQNFGSESAPWKTIGHALLQIAAGQTLYLRDGIYFERLRISRVGHENAKITIRSFPGELAVIDGGIAAFSQQPETAWQPVSEQGLPGKSSVPDYFRSTQTYPNERAMLGYFADSMVPLITYQHREDIEETSRIYFEQRRGLPFPLPVYFGPGIWYDQQTGHVYARLSRTNYNFTLPGYANYQGVRNPSEVGIVISPLSSLPLLLEGAEHVVLQDLVIRGGGENTVLLRDSQFITFDNVVTYCGTYGLRSESSGPVSVLNSAFYGGIPPWFVSCAGSLRNIPGARKIDEPVSGRNENYRDVARLNTHNLIVIEGRTEDMANYAFPGNHHWEFAYCDLTDAHDGIHLGGECTKFHHNRIDRMQDDGLYLSPLTPRYLDEVYVYQNLFVRCTLPLGFGGLTESGGPIYVYRNIIDMRSSVQQSHDKPQFCSGPITGHFRGRHLIDFGHLYFYHNTIISKANPRLIQSGTQDIERTFAMSLLGFTKKNQKRRVFNNLFVYLQGMIPPKEKTLPRLDEDVQVDGNLHWDLVDPAASAAKFAAYHASEFFAKTKANYPPGWEGQSCAGKACFVRFSDEPWAINDYRIASQSDAVGRGISLPEQWRDPLRTTALPDVGALPLGSEPMHVGRIDPATVPQVYAWLER